MIQLRSLLLTCLMVLSLLCQAQVTVTQYQNPLDVSIADPYILKDGDTYYLYGTTYDDGFSVYTSTDLVNWSRHGYCWQRTPTSWGQSSFWAPEVIKAGNMYYLFYTSRNTTINRLNISVASSASPLGPFTDVTTPILPLNQSYIDGSPYHDPVSGKFYLYAVREDVAPSQIVVTELTDPPVSRDGSITLAMTVSQPWEAGWVEAPFIIRHKDTYYMMYSGNTFWENAYAIGYATASDLLGPWTKAAQNPIVSQTATVSGPGHNCAVLSPDATELYTAYHTHLTFDGGGARQLAIDRLKFIPASFSTEPDLLSLAAGHPTSDMQPLPSGAQPRQMGRTERFDFSFLERNKWNIFGEEPSRWSIQYGQLLIETQNGDLSGDHINARNVFLQYIPPVDFIMDTRLNITAEANFEQAFIILWQDQSNFIRLGSVYAGGEKIETGIEVNGDYTAHMSPNIWGSYVRLKIERRGDICTMYAGGGNDDNWTQLGSSVAVPAGQLQVGLGGFSPVSGALKTARFDYFNLEYSSHVNDWQLY